MTHQDAKINANLDLMETIIRANIEQGNIRGARHALKALGAEQRDAIERRIRGLMTREEGNRIEAMMKETIALKFETMFRKPAFA